MIAALLALTLAGPNEVPARIDAEITKQLGNRSPAGAADDAEFVRRVYLDVVGRVPTAAETRAYLDDKATNKHSLLIEKLLSHPEMATHWAGVFDLWLNGRPENAFGRKEFVAYFRDRLAENHPWHQIARELLMPDAADPKQQAAAYFLGVRLRLPKEDQIDGMTVAVASGLFGVRLECCKCHDHPYVDAWKQDHYYGMSAFLARTELVQVKNKPAIGETAEGGVTFTRTNGNRFDAAMMFIDGKTFTPPPLSKNQAENYLTPRGDGKVGVPKFSARRTLADYALTPSNPYFRRAIVNRVWKKLMGRGLVEPVDQIHDENPATHPALFTFLADDFAANRFDLRRLMAGILHSESYRRSGVWAGPGEPPANETYATAVLKPLTSEQLLLSMAVATRYPAKKPGIDGLIAEFDRDFATFADKYESASGGFEATTAQALFMTYNSATQRFLKNGLVADMVKSADADAIEMAYLGVLSRRPTLDERERATRHLAADKSQRERQARDVVWALLNAAEFRFNH